MEGLSWGTVTSVKVCALQLVSQYGSAFDISDSRHFYQEFLEDNV